MNNAELQAPPPPAPWLARLLSLSGLSAVSSKESMAQAVWDQYAIAFAEPEASDLNKLALSLVPEEVCQRHAMIPLKAVGDSIEMLMANPLDAAALDAARIVSGRLPVPVFGTAVRVEELIAAAYASTSVIFDLLSKLPDEASVTWVDAGERALDLESSAAAGPVVKLTKMLIAQAVRLSASDIHIEHEEKTTAIRFRIDGDLRTVMRLPRSVGEGPLVSRVKIMASLDVADRRRPQDGRAKLIVGEEEVGLRVSTVPTSFGEKAVLRILDKRQAEVPLDALGLRPELLERLAALTRANQGMILLTGPTGSGKTTTVYSILHQLKGDDVNIVTVEDPVEYRLDGINQIQVSEKAGMGFASILRSVLRQDPDIVLVGEIRDRETADVAFQAALTGHLVFSTVHANDALSTVNRLLDMGVERFKMVPALIAVLAQRLARRICSGCRVETLVDPSVAPRLAAAGLPRRQFKGTGCIKCAFTGLRGRIALAELLDLGQPAARERVGAGGELRQEALEKGWLKTLSEDALWHLAQGDLPLEEAAPYIEALAPAAAPAAPAATRRPRVLIVDDVEDNRALARASLAAEGYDVSEAAGGAAALEAVARNRPDVVLLDLMMPEMDGYSVVKRLRADLGLSDLPIMALTALTEAESQAQAFELGADDYLTKPFNPRILRARVKALLRRRDLSAR